MKAAIPSFLAIALIAGVQDSPPLDAASAEIFRRPDDFVGRDVRLCDYVTITWESHNIWSGSDEYPTSRPGNGVGLDIPDIQTFGFRMNAPMCLEGQIYRSGCREEVICTWSSFDYGLRNIRPTAAGA